MDSSPDETLSTRASNVITSMDWEDNEALSLIVDRSVADEQDNAQGRRDDLGLSTVHGSLEFQPPWSALHLWQDHPPRVRLDQYRNNRASVSQAEPSSIYYSATTGNNSVFYSATSKPGMAKLHDRRMRRLKKETDYEALLRSTGVALDEDALEQDWSGRGQHIQFANDDIGLVNQLLTVQDTLGKGNTAVVHSVKCRRILLARKTIYTNKRFTKLQAAKEVSHLTRIKHSHVVRLIGTYTWKTELSILMYPVADYNMNGFLNDLIGSPMDHCQWKAAAPSCWGLFACLSSALSHIHSTFTKHLDIKPQNILVCIGSYSNQWFERHAIKVYIADFGIARSYQTADAIDTDSATAFTRKYAAPEIVQQDVHGLPADVFSLGCVFLEMFATFRTISSKLNESSEMFWGESWTNNLTDRSRSSVRQKLESILASGPDASYHSSLVALSGLLREESNFDDDTQPTNMGLAQLIANMIAPEPHARPTASHVTKMLPARGCCVTGPDALQEARTLYSHTQNIISQLYPGYDRPQHKDFLADLMDLEEN